MISPEEIRRKAARKYKPFLRDWIVGRDDGLFPMTIRSDRTLPGDDNQARTELQHLFAEAKGEGKRHGYSIDWEMKNYRDRGRNRSIKAIYFESREDWLKTIGKWNDFKRTERAAGRIRARFPSLEPWLHEHVIELAGCEPHLDGLFEVVRYFLANPRPGLYVRQLPLTVDTKFIEHHENVLRQWLDLLLPAGAVNSTSRDFARRFGLREVHQTYRIRVLDPDLLGRSELSHDDLALPLEYLARLDFADITVIIVENLASFLSLPPHPRAVALWGGGNAVQRLVELDWLHRCEILYWGDIDVAGFQILANLRQRFASVTTIFMDIATVEAGEEWCAACAQKAVASPPLLTQQEQAAFQWSVSNQRRIEQERIPQPIVDAALARLHR